MVEIKKGNHIMKLFNWLRGLFRKKEWTPHDKEWHLVTGPKYTPLIDTSVYGSLSDEQAAEAFQRWETKRLATKAILPSRIHLGGPFRAETWADADYDRSVRNGFLSPEHEREYNLRAEIARLRCNKKKHSHLQKELDALIDSGADTQTNNGEF